MSHSQLGYIKDQGEMCHHDVLDQTLSASPELPPGLRTQPHGCREKVAAVL